MEKTNRLTAVLFTAAFLMTAGCSLKQAIPLINDNIDTGIDHLYLLDTSDTTTDVSTLNEVQDAVPTTVYLLGLAVPSTSTDPVFDQDVDKIYIGLDENFSVGKELIEYQSGLITYTNIEITGQQIKIGDVVEEKMLVTFNEDYSKLSITKFLTRDPSGLYLSSGTAFTFTMIESSSADYKTATNSIKSGILVRENGKYWLDDANKACPTSDPSFTEANYVDYNFLDCTSVKKCPIAIGNDLPLTVLVFKSLMTGSLCFVNIGESGTVGINFENKTVEVAWKW